MARRRRRRLNDFGMSRNGRFVMLPFYLLNSPAYRSLNCTARALIPEVAKRFNGENNGRISLSVREAAAGLGVNKDTAGKAFHALMDRGFLEAKVKGSFDWKQSKATEWRLTWLPCGGDKPTKEFMSWDQPEKKQITVPLRGTAGPKFSDRGAQESRQITPDGPKISDHEAQKQSSHGPKISDTYNIPCGACFAEQPSQGKHGNGVTIPPLPTFLDRRRNGSCIGSTK